jgi:hypothetical protein
MFDSTDKIFISTLLKNCEKYLKDCMKKTLKYKIVVEPNKDNELIAFTVKKNIKTERLFFPIGVYHNNEQEFRYYKGWNNVLLEHVQKYDDIIKYDETTDIFSSTINKLFENTVKISPKDYLVIPCLLAIANPAFNIVEFETENTNVKIYALIELDTKCQFNYNKFLKDWSITKSVIFLKNNYDKSDKLHRSSKEKTTKKKQSKKKSHK